MKFEFNEEDHSYLLDGKRMTGVTTVVGIIDKSSALIPWAVNMAIDHLQKYPGDWEGAKSAHRVKKEKAGDLGTQTHFWVEQYVKSQIAGTEYLPKYESDQIKKMVEKFIEWGKDNDVKFLLSEQRVYSAKHFFAGTCDLLVEIKGKKYIADLKTAKDIYLSNYIQMAGYHICLEELGKVKDLEGYIVINIPKEFKKTGEAKIKEKRLYNMDECKSAFLHCLGVYRFINKIKI
jgi:hypothetical protein